MSQKEFLEELRTALSGKLSAQAVLENIEYYRNYIEGEVRSGKSEAQVLEMLGDPWILARTISDAQDGTDDSIVNEAGGSDYGAYGEETGRQDMHFQELRFPWWKIALIILAVIPLICKFVLDWYLNTRSGYLLRAAGDNDALVTSLAEDKGRVKIIGLAIANGFAALAGGVLAQKQAFFDISIGTGTMVFGLASVILGTQLFHRFGKLKATTAVIAGAILYKACVAFVISMRIVKATDLKLITAAILLLILIVSDSMKRKGAHHA